MQANTKNNNKKTVDKKQLKHKDAKEKQTSKFQYSAYCETTNKTIQAMNDHIWCLKPKIQRRKDADAFNIKMAWRSDQVTENLHMPTTGQSQDAGPPLEATRERHNPFSSFKNEYIEDVHDNSGFHTKRAIQTQFTEPKP